MDCRAKKVLDISFSQGDCVRMVKQSSAYGQFTSRLSYVAHDWQYPLP